MTFSKKMKPYNYKTMENNLNKGSTSAGSVSGIFKKIREIQDKEKPLAETGFAIREQKREVIAEIMSQVEATITDLQEEIPPTGGSVDSLRPIASKIANKLSSHYGINAQYSGEVLLLLLDEMRCNEDKFKLVAERLANDIYKDILSTLAVPSVLEDAAGE
ncbi:MAG: hypothetical protein WCV72_00865 [Patescibacteria group bacterium]